VNDDPRWPEGTEPPPSAEPIAPAPTPQRSRSGLILLAFAVAALAAGAGWFLYRLQPKEDPAQAASAMPVDTVQIIQPRSGPPGEITAADLPGFEADGLTPGQLRWLYHKARLEECGCGCGWNVAECRINDPNCPKSPGRAVELVAEARKQKI